MDSQTSGHPLDFMFEKSPLGIVCFTHARTFSGRCAYFLAGCGFLLAAAQHPHLGQSFQATRLDGLLKVAMWEKRPCPENVWSHVRLFVNPALEDVVKWASVRSKLANARSNAKDCFWLHVRCYSYFRMGVLVTVLDAGWFNPGFHSHCLYLWSGWMLGGLEVGES